MNLDYEDLDRATRAHALLHQHRVKVTFFPNLSSTVLLRGNDPPKLFHRIVIDRGDAELADRLLRELGLAPPL
jgi:hypothetical protein